MARVWAARQHGQRGFQKLVAIKTILPHLADETEFERMFLDEARIASGVHHPNVCEIYELGDEKRTLYLAMEWVNGDSLSRVMRVSGKTEPLDPRVISRIIADACAGVHAAHELADEDGQHLNVVHRDLSPHNILLTADGVTKVCDFGVAKALGQLHEQTSAGQLKGKISYMSPEQVTGSGLDRRSDVFSLGCVLYEATTGERPFKGDRDHQIMHAILQSEIAPPSSIVRHYPAELERIVLRALAHQPILRYPTAERMRFALEEYLTKGLLVTQSNVAQMVRQRIGEQLERRKERIKQASSIAEQRGWDPASVPPSRDPKDHQSGVKQARPLGGTVPMPAVTPEILDNPLVRAALEREEPLPPGDGTVVPPTPRIGTPPAGHASGQQEVHSPPQHHLSAAGQPSSQGQLSVPTPAMMLDSDTIFSATPSSLTTIPQVPTASPASESSFPSVPPFNRLPPPAEPDPMGGPTLTLPIGPGQVISPLAGRPELRTPSDYSSPGAVVDSRRDWSSPGHDTMPFVDGQEQSRPLPSIPASSAATLPPTSRGAQSQKVPNAPYSSPTLVGSAHAEPEAGAGHYALGAIVGLLVAVIIGGGGFVFYQTRVLNRPFLLGSSEPTPSGGGGLVASPAPSPSSAVAPAGSALPSGVDITFRVHPTEATILVDGRDLGPTRAMPRPAVGKTVTVVARAKGHEDATVLVDYFTTTPLELTLRQAAESDAGSAALLPAVGANGSPKPHPPRPRPKEAKDPNAIPDNPY
jgi:serine/threonine protein kinase